VCSCLNNCARDHQMVKEIMITDSALSRAQLFEQLRT